MEVLHPRAGAPTEAPDDAALILNRKVAQGMVERIRRGLYRVDADHPVIARRRLQLAFP